jgi:hypothetical protein
MSSNARKKEKHRLKRKKRQMTLRKAQMRGPLQRLARGEGELECWVNSDWRKEGIASIICLGTAPDGRCAMAGFLVDLWCVGLKDAWGHREISRLDFEEDVLDRWSKRQDVEEIDEKTVRRLVAGAIRFSRKNGFRLPPHFDRWVSILGDLGDLAAADLSDFGVDGKLRYVGTEEFLRQRLIGCTMEQFMSRPDVEVIMGEPGFLPIGEEDEEEYYDEEGDDDEDDDDLTDEEIEARAEVMGALVRSARSMADAVRKWCFQQAVIPSDALEEAASILLATLLPMAVAENPKELEQYPKPAEALARLMESRPPDQQDALRRGIDQVMQFMKQFKTPQEMLDTIGEVEGQTVEGDDRPALE